MERQVLTAGHAIGNPYGLVGSIRVKDLGTTVFTAPR